jgi:hypothetical protein
MAERITLRTANRAVPNSTAKPIETGDVAADRSAPGRTRRIKRLMDRIDTRAACHALRVRSGNWLARGLVAAVLIQAISIGVLGAKLYATNDKSTYRTLSRRHCTGRGPGSIRVVPDAGMTISDWNALLHSLRLQVVAARTMSVLILSRRWIRTRPRNAPCNSCAPHTASDWRSPSLRHHETSIHHARHGHAGLGACAQAPPS